MNSPRENEVPSLPVIGFAVIGTEMLPVAGAGKSLYGNVPDRSKGFGLVALAEGAIGEEDSDESGGKNVTIWLLVSWFVQVTDVP